MKILVLSDSHGERDIIPALAKISEQDKPSGAICCGDITSSKDQVSYLEEMFALFNKRGIPFFTVWGNCDGPKTRRKIAESAHNIHLTQKRLGDYSVFGFVDVEEAPLLNSEAIREAIVVTHRPPLKEALSRKSRNAPAFHISGHLHGAAWLKKYPATCHLQVPAASKTRGGLGEYCLFDPGIRKARFLKLGS